MLDSKSSAVLAYIKNYFANSTEPLYFININIDGLTNSDIETSLTILENSGEISINTDYVQHFVEYINN